MVIITGCLYLIYVRGATLRKLEIAAFRSDFEQIGDFLQGFERVALAASAQNTLSDLSSTLHTPGIRTTTLSLRSTN